MANEIAFAIIERLPGEKSGPEYYVALSYLAAYWETVLAGHPSPAAKQAADKALSKLLKCDAQVTGHKLGLVEKISRAIR